MSSRVNMEKTKKRLSKQPNSPLLSCQPYPTVPLTKANQSAEASMAEEPSPIDGVRNNGLRRFHDFLKLGKIFYDLPPATIYTALNLPNHNLYQAVDVLLFARRCKEFCDRNQAKKCTPCDLSSPAVMSEESSPPNLPTKTKSCRIPKKPRTTQKIPLNPNMAISPFHVTDHKGNELKDENGDIITIDMPVDENFFQSP